MAGPNRSNTGRCAFGERLRGAVGVGHGGLRELAVVVGDASALELQVDGLVVVDPVDAGHGDVQAHADVGAGEGDRLAHAGFGGLRWLVVLGLDVLDAARFGFWVRVAIAVVVLDPLE